MKRKLPFGTPDSRTHPASPFSANGLSPIVNLATPQSQPAPGFPNNLPPHGGHLNLTPNHMAPALPLLEFQTPDHGNDQALVGIAALGGNMVIGTPGVINGHDMLNVMNPYAGTPVPLPDLPFEHNNNEDSDGDTDTFMLSSSDNESDTKSETEDERQNIPDQELVDAAMIFARATPVRTPITTPVQQTPVLQIPNTAGTMPLDGLSPLEDNEDTFNPFTDEDTTSDSESNSNELDNGFILEANEELPFHGEDSLFSLKDLETDNT